MLLGSFLAAASCAMLASSAPAWGEAADGAAIAGVTPAFTSSNEKLATVDAMGKVTAVNMGAVTITAKSGDKTADTKMTIKKK